MSVDSGATVKTNNFKAIESDSYDDIRLESLEIGITSKCNFNCRYCCAYDKKSDLMLSSTDVIGIIKELPDLKRVKLSGGEVTIFFDDCEKIIEYCAGEGIETQINTNGSLLDKNKINRLNRAGLDYMHISVNHTDSRQFSEYYSVDKKVFKNIARNLRLCAKQKNLDTIAETIIFSSTEDSICDVHRYISSLGVRKHEIQLGIPVVQAGWKELTPVPALVSSIKRLIDEKCESTELYFSCLEANLSDCVMKALRSYVGKKDGIHFPSCVEGRRQLHLHNNGDVLICELGYPVVINNIFKGKSLSEMLADPPDNLVEFVKSHKCDKAKFYGIESEKACSQI